MLVERNHIPLANSFKGGVVVQLLTHVWLCNSMDAAGHSSLFLTISQSLPKFMATELLVMLSNHLILCHSLLLLSIFPSIRIFSYDMSRLFTSGSQSIGASASASVLPMSTQGWFPLGLTGLISFQSKGLSRVFSSTTVWKHHSLVLSLLYGPTLTLIHDYWRDHSFDCMDLCQQSDVSAF